MAEFQLCTSSSNELLMLSCAGLLLMLQYMVSSGPVGHFQRRFHASLWLLLVLKACTFGTAWCVTYSLEGSSQPGQNTNQECHTFFGSGGYGCCPQSDVFVNAAGQRLHSNVRDLMESVRGGSLTFIGDSIMMQTYYALLHDIRDAGINMSWQGVHYEYGVDGAFAPVNSTTSCGHNTNTKQNECSSNGTKRDCDCTVIIMAVAHDYNATFRWAWAYEITPPTAYLHGQGPPQNAIRHTLFEHLVKTSSSVIVNAGLHYTRKKSFVFAFVVQYVVDTLAADMAANQTKRHLWWLTVPQHFPVQHHELGVPYETYNATLFAGANHTACRQKTQRRHFTDSAAQGIIGNQLDIVDAFSIFSNRGDLHSRHKVEAHQPLDCSHSCYNVELYAALWHLFGNAIARH